MTDGSEIAESLKRSLRIVMIATVLLYVIVTAVGVLAYRDAGEKRDALARQADETRRQAAETKKQVAKLTAVQCTLRRDLERRAAEGEEFLRAYPNGTAALPVGAIKQSLEGQRRTIKALSGLKCRPA